MRQLGLDQGYPLAWQNHPCSKWATSNSVRWRWLRQLGLELCKEYTYRYGRVHTTQALIENAIYPVFGGCWITPNLEPFEQCMLPQYKCDDAITAYRNYYIGAKQHLLSYTKREVPFWLLEIGLGVQK